jgi:predicted transcriptional regulator
VRVPTTVRARATTHALRRRDGATVREIAEELGLSHETIRRWTKTATRAAQPVPVRVVAGRTAESTKADVRAVSIVSPTGYRVEGLSLEEAALLLRSLA